MDKFTPNTFVKKGWGSELWIVNNELYCGKVLSFSIGKKCSWHYHKLKDETFYISHGSFSIKYSYEDDIEKADKIILSIGQKFHVPVGLRHQMKALDPNSEIIEFSTKHHDSDSYRIIKGD